MPDCRPSERESKLSSGGGTAITVKQLLTAEEALTLPEVPGRRFELVNGGIEFDPDDDLDGGDVLPGLRLKVSELFEVDA